MSLFRTKEWWRVDCGSEETFDGQSLLIVPFFGADRKDVIIVGSHSGYLRIYSPSCTWNEESNSVTGYKITDLIIETHIVDCIIDLKAGKFVSGSQELQLAILTPSKLIVYRVTLSPGSTEHGDRCSVETLYQHELPRFPASLIAGPFGSVQGRDFFCVQCLDATLVFFEQEAHTFDQVLADRLLPQSLTYVARNDVFVTSSAGWVLECYRYQNMAEFGRLVEERDMADDRRLRPDWTYNLGEAVLGIAPVTLSTFEVGIVVLGQRNLYCFRDNCSSIKYTKHLDYNPLCFHAYVIEPDGKLMVLVVADTDTLLLYEGTTLKWSAQLPFTPVAIARAQFQSLEGVIVILSETGRLEACYLGAEPSLFVAPPIHRRGFDYKAAEKELAELRKMAKSSSTSGVPNATLESELLITVHVSQELSSSSLGQDEAEDTCRIGVELSSYSPLVDVQIYLQPLPPLGITEDFYSFSSLRDRQLVQTTVFIQGDLPGLSSIVHLTASYELEGEFRIVQKTIQLPLRMLLRPCPPENTASFATTIKCADPLVNLSQLFPEFIERQSNALGLRHNRTGHVVTIVAGTNTNRYRVQSNEPLSMTLVVEQLLSRLRARAPGSIVASISQNLQLVQLHIETHFESRQRVKRASKEIAALSGQLRAIEKRLLRAMRDTSAKSLSSSGLTILLDWTYNAMKKELDQLQAAHAEREQAGHALQCALRLLLLLLRPNVQDDKYTMLESAIGFEPQLREDVDWEEVADVALFALLRVTSKKPENEPSTRQLTWNKFESAQDLVKLKKRLVHAVERLNKPVDTVQEDESDNFTT